ncbi:MAG TPA: zinc ribbon domain-containing protein [Thermoleophilaceae bacterium]
MDFVAIAFVFGLATGAIGRLRGSSFLIWFLVGFALPGIGIIAALFMRRERDEPRRRCPECGKLVAVSDQVCMRCGHDLDFPDEVIAAR